VSQRCGRVFDEAYQHDKEYLFYHWMTDGRNEHGRYITSFFVKRSVFILFFINYKDVLLAAAALATTDVVTGAYSSSGVQAQPQETVPVIPVVPASAETAPSNPERLQQEAQQAVVLHRSNPPAEDQPMGEAGVLTLYNEVGPPLIKLAAKVLK
jgi:hypothetical protein